MSDERLSFVYTFDQVAQFQAWWTDTLLNGGAWFASSWRTPQGGSAVRKFVGEPQWTEFIANVGWKMSATFEVRGVGMPPQSYISYGWDPADKSALVILSGGNRYASINDASFLSKWALCTLALGSGKWFFEVDVFGAIGTSAVRPGFGLGTKGYDWASGGEESSNEYPDDGSRVWTPDPSVNAIQAFTAPAYVSGDRLSFAVNLDTRKLWLYKNGTILQGDPAAGTSHSVILQSAIISPLLTPLYWNELLGAGGRLITNPRQFVAAVPAGFTAWGN